jgi:hypothetical protein
MFPNIKSLLRRRICKWSALVGLCLLIVALSGCGGSGNQTVQVAISPATANLYETKTQAFTATVIGTSNSAVTWSVQEGSTGGAVSSSGIYTAPDASGTFHVVATSVANSSRSAVATVTVKSASAPVFTSTPPTAASEGQPYNYSLAANDPAGGTVSYTLSSGPTNAAISGSTLHWTPTHAQSRIANAFVVTATTSEGGNAEQNFSVTPNGTISGIYVSIEYTETGTNTVPFQPQTVIAYVPGANGVYSSISGTGSNGSFSIPGVPAGYYLLDVDGGYLWTSASDIDLTLPLQGRLNYASPQNETTLNIDVTEQTDQNTADCYLFVPNINVFFYDFSLYPPCAGAAWNKSYDWIYALPDATQGDRTYLYRTEATELANNTWTGSVLTDYAGPFSLTIPDGGNVTLSGNLTPQNPGSSVRGNLDIADLVGLEPKVSPNYSGIYSFRMYVQPFTSTYFLSHLGTANLEYTQPPDSFVLYPFTEDGQNVDLGDVSYSNPFPGTWTPYTALTVIGNLPYSADGATVPWSFVAGAGTYSTTFPTGSTPIAPLVGQATGITINGSDFYSDQPNAGAQPVIAWNTPTLGTADGYYLIIYRLDSFSGLTFPGQVSVIATGKTSITLPPGLLQTGYAYVFQLTAFQGNPQVETAPYYNYFPWGYAEAFSGYVHVSSGSLPAGKRMDNKEMRQARQLLLQSQADQKLHPNAKFGVAVQTPAKPDQ